MIADDRYLREAILDPAAKVVTGYQPAMPSYRGHLTDPQIDRLVEYIKQLPHSTTAPSQAISKQPTGGPSQALDQVCQMEVEVAADALQRHNVLLLLRGMS